VAAVCVEGHYGEVLKGKHTDENGRVEDVAIKRLKQTVYDKFASEFEKEFSIMVQLQHPNIVHIIGQSIERTSRSQLILAIVAAYTCKIK